MAKIEVESKGDKKIFVRTGESGKKAVFFKRITPVGCDVYWLHLGPDGKTNGNFDSVTNEEWQELIRLGLE